MGEFFRSLFDTDFMPHVACLRTPGVIWLHVVSDTLIAISYLIIPLGLVRLSRLRKDFVFHNKLALFAGFILSCGATHILSVVTLWTPFYRFEGLLKAVTALISLATVVLLIRLIPRVAELPSADEWRRTKEELQAEIARRAKTQAESELLSAIVAHSENAIISKDLSGNITSWNAGAEHLFGYNQTEAIGQHISLIIPPERAGDEAYLDYIRLSNRIERFETLRMHKDGQRIEVSFVESAIRDEKGEVIGVSKIISDIGGLKRAEEKFQLVVESAPNAIVMINRAGEITLVNQRTEQWFGYTREELLGKPVEILLPEQFRNIHVGHRSGFFTKPVAVGASERAMGAGRELYARRKDGSEFPIEVGLNPLETEEGPMVLSAIVDVTERKKMEENVREFNRILESQVSERTAQLRNANKELEEFAYAASHDLKAPLRVIDNCSRWIEEDLQEHLAGDTRENMNLMRGRIKRMEKLLDDLLDYARIGRTTDARYAETIAGDKLMNNILELLAPVGFTLKVSPSFAHIQVRTMPLQQILMNLIGNAIKHHDKKAGCIEVTVEDLGSHYAFAVKDDGPGIPVRFHEQIFQMFQTLRPRDQVEGSGMGLAMVRKHVVLYGGKIQVESLEGQGSIFRFTWPTQQTLREQAV
jgi:PAS domain S-box-containing protein